MPDTYAGKMVAEAPPWGQGQGSGYGRSWFRGLAAGEDRLLDGTKDAVKARFPETSGTAGDDYALSLIGDDSSLPRYPNETDTTYGQRLRQRWTRYSRGGAADGSPSSTYPCPILEELEGLGFGGLDLVEYSEWPEDPVTPGLHHSPLPWTDSAGTPWWSRIWILCSEHEGAPILAGGILGVGVLGVMRLGINLPAGAVEAAQTAIRTWKPAHVRAVSMIFYLNGGEDGVLGRGVLGTMVLGGTGGAGYSREVVLNF